MAVLVLAGSSAIPVSATLSFVIFGIFIAAIVSAVGQWIASARTEKERTKQVLKVAAVLVAIYMVDFWNCDIWAWLCYAI